MINRLLRFSGEFGWFVITTTALSLTPTLTADAFTVRSIDGTGNNLSNTDFGAADTQLLRLTAATYADGISVPRGGESTLLPSTRAISNAVSAQSDLIPNSLGASDWFWQWGQFLDHDLDLTPTAEPEEPFNILVPIGDPYFDPGQTGIQEIALNRSLFDTTTGTDSSNPRQQLNEITAFIDASNVYGSDAIRAAAIRSGRDGMLMTSTGNNGETLLLLNIDALPNDEGSRSDLSSADFFLAGDVRANEQIGLTAAHTLFVREHNRLAEDLKQRLDSDEAILVAKRDEAIAAVGNGIEDEDDFIYETVRKIVGAQMQIITYEEWLPLLLGDDALSPFTGYDDTVNPGIANEFSTAAFRFGHTMLSPTLLRLNNDGSDAGSLALQNSFFSPDLVMAEGIDSTLLGLASQAAQAIDTLVVDDVRNFLFGPPGAGGFDLASLNLQRGRDHGLPSLNAVRTALGKTAHTSFLDLTAGDVTLAEGFASVYSHIDDVDLWIGGLAEVNYGSSLLGETFHTIVSDQFTRLRDGDRFFYLNELDYLLAIDPDLESVTLSTIISRNSSISNIQANAFLVSRPVPEPMSGLVMVMFGGLVTLVRRRKP